MGWFPARRGTGGGASHMQSNRGSPNALMRHRPPPRMLTVILYGAAARLEGALVSQNGP
jgi:hypothetical protein